MQSSVDSNSSTDANTSSDNNLFPHYRRCIRGNCNISRPQTDHSPLSPHPLWLSASLSGLVAGSMHCIISLVIFFHNS